MYFIDIFVKIIESIRSYIVYVSYIFHIYIYIYIYAVANQIELERVSRRYTSLRWKVLRVSDGNSSHKIDRTYFGGSEYRDRAAYFGGLLVSRSQQHWCQLQSVILFGGFGLTSKVFQSGVSLDRLPRIQRTHSLKQLISAIFNEATVFKSFHLIS